MKRVIERVVGAARNFNASDVHFMPYGDEVMVQVRHGTFLHRLESMTRVDYERLTLHMKYWCSLTETDHRVPQSGMYVGTEDAIRVTFLPSFDHTLMSWRLPNASFQLSELLDDKDVNRLLGLASLRQGLLLIGGATGAGKTTVLYAFLQCLTGRRIVTIENPPEKQVPGVIQLEVNPKAGLDHGNLLKETLRADPDVIVIGEIRTSEELRVAHDAALSGHLTIATFHTASVEDGEHRLEQLVGKMEVARHWCILHREEEVSCSWSETR
ncbi:type II secretion system protein E [Exiguobacterium sp. SL-10]|uniref:ATPase, T2SS/T4P/T4SS family n=1 Tax=unclassified Exiguobacterium TaxID=2644629 RepID=UPI001038B13C|nr:MULTISPECIES: ATPase, T2SS/T4P/T4SS family [unclassified Exiguobacterium]TCI22061.1 type II secretion system protein E [Exiguobacterium sp. SL-9]TCI29538.1 type II secretion system protein E [Exiguobacterium sp. SL-10]